MNSRIIVCVYVCVCTSDIQEPGTILALVQKVNKKTVHSTHRNAPKQEYQHDTQGEEEEAMAQYGTIR